MRTRHLLLSGLLSFICFAASAQKNDSLLKALPGSKGKERGAILVALSKANWNADPSLASGYASQALALADSLGDESLRYDAFYSKGVSVFFTSDFPGALNFFQKAESIAEKQKDKKHIASSLNSIGNVYQQLEEYPKSLDYFERSLKIQEEIHDSANMGSTLANMGGIMDYTGRYDEGVIDFNKAIVIWEKMDYEEGVANCYLGLGSIFSSKKMYDSCLVYYKKALQIKEAGTDRVNLAGLYHNIGEAYNMSGDNVQAVTYLAKARALAEQLHVRSLLVSTYYSLAVAYEALGDLKKAHEFLVLNSSMRDSVFNEDNAKSVSEMATRFETEKKQNEIVLLQKDNKLNELRIKRNSTWLFLLIPGLILIVLIMFVVYGRNAAKKKANRALNMQNELLSQQGKEITDSITYSLSIQQSMLPQGEMISEWLKDHFVLNIPKDIVSGDFYFFEKKGDHFVFSAVDCTGHGVPGALLSFLGMDILREAVRKRSLTKPSDILSYLDKEVNQRLRQSTDKNSVRDGMDLALCTLDLRTNELQFAGAFNPAYIISDGKLTEIKPDKHAIGSNTDDAHDEYTNHVLQLKKGDCIYIFSDGYADQFGGPSGKKFKYRPLQELLLELHSKPMQEQKRTLEQEHKKWKGELFQVDDILMIGVRIA